MGGSAALIGLLAYAGWAFDIVFLQGIRRDFVTMKPNTAVGILMLGTSVVILGLGQSRRFARISASILSLLTAAIGALSLAEYIFAADFGIDQLLFREHPVAIETWSPGRMALITSVCFLIVGVALHMIAAEYRRIKRLPDFFLSATALIALFVLLGYAFDERALRNLNMYGAMALHTAAAFLLICLGSFALRPSEGIVASVFTSAPGGMMLRWVLPAAVTVPILVGWLRWTGEKQGLYGTGVGVALSVVITILLLTILVLLGAAKINRSQDRIDLIEKSARENDERLRTLLNASRMSAYMFDRQGRFVFTNRHTDDLYQSVTGALIGKTLYDLYPAPQADIYHANNERVWNSGAMVEIEETAQISAGTKTYLSHKFPVCDENGEMIALGGISYDITELKNAESEINRFFQLSINLLCIANLDGYFVKLNPMWEQTLGFSNDELTAKPFIEFVHPEDREKTLAEVQKLASGVKVISFENRYLCKDGSYKTLLWNSASAVEYGLIYATAVDITERKQAEADILKLNADLSRQSTALQAANKEIEAFSYSVSHDLRAPLRSIDGFSQALLEDYRDRLDETGRDYLRRVRSAAQRMAQLIDDMLQLSRITRIEPNPEHVNLSAVAGAVIADCRRKSPDRAVEVTIQDGLEVDGDPRLLRVVLENLLGNAWKYTSKKAAAHIEFGSRTDAGDATFFVRDNGAGFDMAYADKLFGAFQRLHSVEEFEGTGIGLATVKRIIHRHGGEVWAEGAVDAGATFYFTLKPTTIVGENDERQDHSAGRGQSGRRAVDAACS